MDILRCLLKIYPDWKGTVWENMYSGIRPHILEKRPIPVLIDLVMQSAAVDKEIIIEDILRKRRAAYGSVESQLEMMYQDKVKNTTVWDAHITAVNLKYPLP